MKSIHLYMLVFGLFIQSVASSQIQSVTLQASGLTCSMCSRAIYKSLQKVPSVAKVKEDLAHSSYSVQFKDPAIVSLENLKKAVIDAGFSVAWMEVKVNFTDVEVASDSSYKLNDFTFLFVDIERQNLSGERKLLILDKDYLPEKDRKKYAGSLDVKSPASDGEKVFHVTLRQS
jgi:copper chaperone CopZ